MSRVISTTVAGKRTCGQQEDLAQHQKLGGVWTKCRSNDNVVQVVNSEETEVHSYAFSALFSTCHRPTKLTHFTAATEQTMSLHSFSNDIIIADQMGVEIIFILIQLQRVDWKIKKIRDFLLLILHESWLINGKTAFALHYRILEAHLIEFKWWNDTKPEKMVFEWRIMNLNMTNEARGNIGQNKHDYGPLCPLSCIPLV